MIQYKPKNAANDCIYFSDYLNLNSPLFPVRVYYGLTLNRISYLSVFIIPHNNFIILNNND